jgi:predicted nucleotidyltransferase
MERNKLISFALNFASFLISRIKVDRVILYGSVAANTFDKESDIDLFVEADKKDKKKIETLLELYKKSSDYEKFKLVGVKNEISIRCGKLEEWKDLKRSMISNGIVLYGRYTDKSEDSSQKVLFMLDVTGFSKTEKIKIWRKIYGYKQKVGKKVYISDSLAEEKIGRGAFLCGLENVEKVKEFLKKNKVKYRLKDIWVG